MNELLPIIRRKRRPLLPVESVSDGPPASPVVAAPFAPVEPVVTESVELVVADEEPKSSDAKAPVKRNPR